MPWYGWLIAGCVGFVGLVILLCVAMWYRAVSKMTEADYLKRDTCP